jgi:hypothetical protein
MSVPGLLIEYLVNGVVALVWAYPLIRDALVALPAPVLAALALSLYVVGMVVDVLGWLLTRRFKPLIRRSVLRQYRRSPESENESSTMRQARIRLHAPELAKELDMRSSRDRIARGLIVNAVLASFFLSPAWIGPTLTVASVILWAMFERLSFMFELCAEEVLNEKLGRGTGRKAA